MAFSTKHSDRDKLKPVGEYECIIADAYQTTTKMGTPYIVVNCSIRTDVGSPCKGMIFHNLWKRKPENMTSDDKDCKGYSSKQINSLSKATGLPEKSYNSLNDWWQDKTGEILPELGERK